MIWLSFFLAAFLLQLAYWTLLRRGFARVQAPPPPPLEAAPGLSVVIAARNEADRLPGLLEALSGQQYPAFEVVLIDDHSTDETAAVAGRWAARDDRIRLLPAAPGELPRKKQALTTGIRAARHPWLAFTDADCTPPPGWLGVLAAYHAAGPAAVLVGYGPYRKHPGLLNRFVRYETLLTAFFAAGAIGLGRPYMAVGRNLSYARSLFERVNGFDHAAGSLSGDDDLLVQEIARRKAGAVRFVADARAFVPSEPPRTWRAWLRQKRRHTSAGRFYDRRIQLHLALFHAANLALWVAPGVLGWTGAGLLGGRLLLEAWVLRRAARVFGEADLLPAQPLLAALYAAYNAVVAPLGVLFRPKGW